MDKTRVGQGFARKSLVSGGGKCTQDAVSALFDNTREYLSYDELAKILGVSTRTIRRYMDLGKIPRRAYTKLGKTRSSVVRFSRTEIAALLFNNGAGK